MKYYKVKRDCMDWLCGWSFIENELLTEKERNRKARYLFDECFEIVNINKNNTFINFGVRFEKK